ncbi:MAG TPA: hypothetical protein DCK93_18950 [Blastocatellia bacterium]|jgi:hypothetical protein|nr:hypothetical protein [Blastocatellia bacterium]
MGRSNPAPSANRLTRDTIVEMTIDDKIAKLDKECPLVPHTHAGRMYSAVRRIQAEIDQTIERYGGFPIR